MLPRRFTLLAPTLACALVAATAVAGCGGDDSDGRPIAVATAPQVDGLLQQLAGKGVDVQAVVSPTADVHELELRPSQVRAIEHADLIVRPGRGNDLWAQEALTRSDAKQVDASQGLPGSQRHWWMDPTFASSAATRIAGALDALDPAGKTARASKLAAIQRELATIDRETKACLATVPAGGRKIVTDHDAAGAYAERYGLTVVGTISPGAEPEAAPSAQRVAELVKRMRAQQVAALFPIAPHGSALSKAIAQQGGAKLGQPLWADALPPATAGGTAADASTVQAAALRNGRSVADALGATGTACSAFPKR